MPRRLSAEPPLANGVPFQKANAACAYGSFLDVHAEPDAAAPAVTCVAGSVLMERLDETSSGGDRWAQVRTPSGAMGWVPASKLD